MKIYRVGGAVRDRILGRPVQDTDWVVVGATPEDMTAQGFKPVGSDFPVFLHPVTGEEYALARTERKSGRGYKGFTIHSAPDVTVEDDLRRRDLTINAIAEDEHGNVIDPFSGRADLERQILRHVSPAFVEDPLRVLRVARFAARLSFAVAPETLQLMSEMVAAGELSDLVPERVWAETERALGEPEPARYFATLRECGALRHVFPEIEALFGVPQPERHHPEIDTGVHSLMVLEQAATLSADATTRFAALVHDLGKALTPASEWPSHGGHEERGVELINNMCDRFRAPNRFRELAIIVARHHLDCHRIAELRVGTILKKLEATDGFRRPERFEQFLLACEADARGRTGFERRDYPQAALWRAALTAARNADLGDLNLPALGGEAAAAAIRKRRVEAIREVLES
ncbi:MAG: multifunctional CCA addition/repair protein [Gammaproteobacteria bacterium]|nr:multifunctional CCA addition/repair protein [Gammaproteobacteria bacterium]